MKHKKSTQQESPKPYHHGNLRDALIVAAAELIEESGSADFSVSDTARRAGVSNAAPYRHFADKEALLQAVSELGFFAMDEGMREIANGYEYGSQACIVELGKGYIRFVTSRPAFFNLMWGEEGSATMERMADSHRELRQSGFWLLVNQIEAWCEKQHVRNTEPLDIALKLWAMAIGISHLVINNHLERYVAEVDPYQILATSSDAFLRGLLNSE
ncbi:MAG: TetR/AcrR family transcriptional regulator [Halioglobus sp.]